MLVPMALPPQIAVRSDGPAIALSEAERMTPAALADVLLASGHPPIVEADVGPEGMMPPAPPGVPVVNAIRLYTAATPADHPGFCEKTRIDVSLAPRMRRGDAVPAAPADAVTTTKLYRWARPAKDGTGCEAPAWSFFRRDDVLGDRSFSVVRRFATLRPARLRKLRITIDDRLTRNLADMVKAYPQDFPGISKDRLTPITDGRVALARFPISSIRYVAPYNASWPNDLLDKADLRDAAGREFDAVMVGTGGEWHAGIVFDGDQIVTIRFVRAIPPPS